MHSSIIKPLLLRGLVLIFIIISTRALAEKIPTAGHEVTPEHGAALCALQGVAAPRIPILTGKVR